MRLASIAAVGILAAGSASGATLFTDETAWSAAMSSVTSVTLPSASAVNSFSAGDLTFTRDGGASNLYSGGPIDWSSLISGNDLAISGPEDARIDFGTAVTGFAFLLHEPTAANGLQTDSCNWAACVDTTFTFSLYDGAVLIDSFTVNPADDSAVFLGFASNTAFDAFVIDDVTGNPDNEYFGEFRTGTLAAVSLPGTLPLLAGVMGGMVLGWRRRRG